MKVIIALIQTLGFPVACVIGLAYFAQSMINQSNLKSLAELNKL